MKSFRGEIEFRHVWFAYRGEEWVLRDVSFKVAPGQRVAFVGATGAGKTTITNLINRFYDIDDGKIRYDGINVNKIRKADLRRSLGIVLQEVNLFTGTVMLTNPETQDVIGIFYSLDVSAENRQREIFNIITGEEYDFVALLHDVDSSEMAFRMLKNRSICRMQKRCTH